MRCLSRLLLIALACACGAATLAAQDNPQAPPLETKPKQKSKTWTNDDLQNLSGSVNVIGKDSPAPAGDIATSGKKAREEEKCESDAWVAAVTAVLNQQGVPYKTRYWSERLFGDACTSNVSVPAVAGRIDGDYTLDDGRKLHLASTVSAGLPAAAAIVSSVDENRPLIIKWKGQPLVMTKVDYIDRQYNYVSVYSISSLMLANALTGRVLIFDMKTNSEKEVEGTLQVKVSKRQ